MEYRNLQRKLKIYRLAGLTDVKLNEKKAVLEQEYQHCLKIEISETRLEKRISYQQRVQKIVEQQSSLAYLKLRVYSITNLDGIRELRRNYYQIKEKKLDFRKKTAWQECLKILEAIHSNTILFEQFTTTITSRIKKYKALVLKIGQDSSLPIQELLEIKDVIKEYIPDTLPLTPQQQLMQTWLQQTLANHKIQLM